MLVSCYRCNVICNINTDDKNTIYCKDCLCMEIYFAEELENQDVLNEIKKQQIERSSQIYMNSLNKDMNLLNRDLSRSEPIHISVKFREMNNCNKKVRRKTLPLDLESSRLIQINKKIINSLVDTNDILLVKLSTDEDLRKLIPE